MDNEEIRQLISEADNHYSHGRMDEAYDGYLAVLAQDDTVAWAHSRIGAIFAQRGQLEEAEAELQKALEFDPELPQAHSNLGNICYTRGEYARAAEYYQTAAKIDPANPLYLENLHAALKKQRKYSEAVKAIKQSHKLVRDTSTRDTKAQFETVKRRVGCTSVIGMTLLLVGLIALTAYIF